MGTGQEKTALNAPPVGVEVINSDTVRQTQALAKAGWGAKRVAKEIEIS